MSKVFNLLKYIMRKRIFQKIALREEIEFPTILLVFPSEIF